MKAHEVSVGQKVSTRPPFEQTGIIVSIQSRQGDEVVIVEWNLGYDVHTVNVNDLILGNASNASYPEARKLLKEQLTHNIVSYLLQELPGDEIKRMIAVLDKESLDCMIDQYLDNAVGVSIQQMAKQISDYLIQELRQ